LLDPEGEALLDELLGVQVDRQHDVVAGRGRDPAEVLVEDLPLRVHLELASPRAAVEIVFVRRLHARFADDLARAVPLERRVVQLGLGDLAHVAEDVGREVAVRVLAQGSQLVGDPREHLGVLLDVEDLLLRHVLGHRDRLVWQVADAVQAIEDVL
jgi:hypothetical protein